MADDETSADVAADTPLSIREPPRILVPVEVLDGEPLSRPLIEFLQPATVVVLGYHVLPEQTPTEQASMQFEDRARSAVEDIAQSFEADGREVTTRVAFTHDRDQTLERVASEVGATAVLLPNPVGEISDVLVPLRGAVDVNRLADLVATLTADGQTQVTLWALSGGPAAGQATELLEDALSTLRERGVAEERFSTETSAVEFPTRAIVNRSGEFDIIVMGEGEQSLLTTVLGDRSERIAEGASAPVLVVRGREESSE